jgi:hypothetical protein
MEKEITIPVLGLQKGGIFLAIGATAFAGVSFVFFSTLLDPAFDYVTIGALGALWAVTLIGMVATTVRYFAEEIINRVTVNSYLKEMLITKESVKEE